MTFATRLRQWTEPLVVYEAVPPTRDVSDEIVADRAERVAHLLADREVDAINVPEIRVEADGSGRELGELQKRDPREFGRRVADRMAADTDVVANRAVVHDPPAVQADWFETAYAEYGVENVVIVGGGSSGMEYPGPSVSEGVELARRVGDAVGGDPCLGGITIPSRRREEFDEPDRMLAKQESGVDFFTSQVVFDPDPTVRLLRDYEAVCCEAGIDPAPVFLSFAPITRPADARFLEQLGVKLPTDVRDWILAADDHSARRSVRVAEHVLDEVLTAIRCDSLAVPLGINVGHIMQYNLDASGRLLDRLNGLLEWHQRDFSPTLPAHR